MRKVSEYLDHAAECRRLAKRMQKLAHREQLEDMAQAWEMLARERENQLVKQLEGGIKRRYQNGRDNGGGVQRNYS
jgi:ribosomal protein L17